MSTKPMGILFKIINQPFPHGILEAIDHTPLNSSSVLITLMRKAPFAQMFVAAGSRSYIGHTKPVADGSRSYITVKMYKFLNANPHDHPSLHFEIVKNEIPFNLKYRPGS
jgi:hypothetical protein